MADIRMKLRRLLGGEEPQQHPPSKERERPPLTEQELVGDENNDFALAIYEQLRSRPGNLFLSPFSIRSALCMIEAGARKETAAEMRTALRISSSGDNRADLVNIVQRLKLANDGKYEMTVANSLWPQDGAPLQPEFVDLIVRDYDGHINLVDYQKNADAACLEINRWVEDKTRQKIRDLIPPGSLGPLTRLVLVNAVYFKGTWVLKFRKSNTNEQPFFLEGGGKVRVPLMYQQHDRIRYFQGFDFQAVELIYESGDLSMLVILPDRNDGLSKLEKTLSARLLRDCVQQMNSREVKLFLPRFKTTWDGVDISMNISALGMPLAFKPFQADFSGINGIEPPDERSLNIGAVFHKAFVDVYEEGTEAAAATGVVAMCGAALYPPEPPPVPIFRADHPFIFAIRDRQSGTILFLGRMLNPTLAS